MTRNIKVRVGHHGISFYDNARADARAPLEGEHRPSVAEPYVGPRTPAEWSAAFAEMAANDRTFSDWQHAERAAELAAKMIQ